MKILITGGTGFIGRKLLLRLFREGHDLVLLSRDSKKAVHGIGLPCEVFECDLTREIAPNAALSGVDAVIHLAGESLAAGRWTATQKEKIRNSRIIGTRNLVSGFKQMGSSVPQLLISVSAVGFYGDRGDETLIESSGAGGGFLAEVCRDWEAEANSAASLGTRIVNLRLGVVLGRDGGVLSQILSPFAIGLGTTLGSGKQWMSWVHIDDVIETFCFVLKNESTTGPLNLVAPHPVTNDEFTKTLARTLQSKALLRAPTPFLKWGLGEMSEMVLNSARVLPSQLDSRGYKFAFPTLRKALNQIYAEFPNQVFESFQFIARPIQEVFAFFSEAKNLETLTPPWLDFEIASQSDGSINAGTEIEYRLKVHGLPIRWISRIAHYKINESFADEQIKGPYAKWYHSHEFENLRGGTLVTDHVSHRLPMGLAGRLVAGRFVEGDVQKIFSFRRKKLAEIFTGT